MSMSISRIGTDYVPSTFGVKKASHGAGFSGHLEGGNQQYAPGSASAGTEEKLSLTELYYRMRWGIKDEKEKKKHAVAVEEADAKKAEEGQAGLKTGKAGKSRDEKNVEEEEQGSKTDTDIIVKADGSRVLVVTTTIGDMKTTMSLEISKPTDMPNEAHGEEAEAAEGNRGEGDSSD